MLRETSRMVAKSSARGSFQPRPPPLALIPAPCLAGSDKLV
jgi:hypothetical protein